MKVCPTCLTRFEALDWRCPACDAQVTTSSGILHFAPGFIEEGAGFNPAYFDELAQLESANFWFSARNRLVTQMLGCYFPQGRNFLEIDCGTGYVLSGIAKAFPHVALTGSELFAQGLPFAAQRVPAASMFQMDARAIPFENEFDVVGAFDVLEHIDEDERVLSQMHQAVATGGGIMLTVPQHRFLWSHQDEYACHVRRYEAADLRRKVEDAGFEIVRMTSFVSLLLPLMYLARRLKQSADKPFDPLDELRIGGLTNVVLKTVLNFEVSLIRAGLTFPAGGSLILIAMKR